MQLLNHLEFLHNSFTIVLDVSSWSRWAIIHDYSGIGTESKSWFSTKNHFEIDRLQKSRIVTALVPNIDQSTGTHSTEVPKHENWPSSVGRTDLYVCHKSGKQSWWMWRCGKCGIKSLPTRKPINTQSSIIRSTLYSNGTRVYTHKSTDDVINFKQ